MGILEHVSGLEEEILGTGERPQQKAKAKKSDGRNPSPQKQTGGRLESKLEKIEESIIDLGKRMDEAESGISQLTPNETQPLSDAIARLQEDVGALQETAQELGSEKSGSEGSDIQSMASRLDELENRIVNGKDYSGEIEELRVSLEDIKNSMSASNAAAAQGKGAASSPDMENMKRIADKNYLEMKSRMDVLQKYVDGKIGAIGGMIDEKLSGLAPHVPQDYGENIESLRKSIDELKNKDRAGIEKALKNYDERFKAMEKRQNELASKISEDVSNSMKDSIKHSVAGFKSGIDRHINDSIRKVNDAADKIGKDQEKIRKSLEEKLDSTNKEIENRTGNKLNDISKKIEAITKTCDEKIGNAEANTVKYLSEAKSRMDALRKSVEEKLNATDEVAEKMVEGRFNDLSKKLGEVSKYCDEKIGNLEAGADKRFNEKMKNMEESINSIGRKQGESESRAGEILRKIDMAQKSIDEKISKTRKDIEQEAGNFISLGDMDKIISRMEGKLADISKRMDSFKNSADSAVSEALKNVPKRDDVRKELEGRVGALAAKSDLDRFGSAFNRSLDELSERIDKISKYDLDKLRTLADSEKRLDENLKLFALNADVEKTWKEVESLKRYVDEKSKGANALANSLRVWETRSLQLMEKEREFEEKMKALPELKTIESRIRKIERAFTELQKHFVASRISEPVIME